MKKQTILTLLVIVVVLSFFVTPLGFESKVFLNRLFLKEVSLKLKGSPEKLATYKWKLKDPDWNFFSLEKSKGKVIVLNFWNTWDVTCVSQLDDLQKLYEQYHNKINFYFITNELQEPVKGFLKYRQYSFPPTYLILEEKHPLKTKAPSTYIIGKDGSIVVAKEGSYHWNTKSIKNLLQKLVNE